MNVAAIRRGPGEEWNRQRGATLFCSFAEEGRAYYYDPQCPGQRRHNQGNYDGYFGIRVDPVSQCKQMEQHNSLALG